MDFLRWFSLIDIRPRLAVAAISFCMNALSDSIAQMLGLGMEPKDLTFLQLSLRGVIIFLVTLVMVRLSSRRSLAEKTAFDAILLVILASILSRAINGSATFFGSIGASFVLVFLHRFLPGSPVARTLSAS